MGERGRLKVWQRAEQRGAPAARQRFRRLTRPVCSALLCGLQASPTRACCAGAASCSRCTRWVEAGPGGRAWWLCSRGTASPTGDKPNASNWTPLQPALLSCPARPCLPARPQRDLPYELTAPGLRTVGQTVAVPSEAPYFGSHYRVMTVGGRCCCWGPASLLLLPLLLAAPAPAAFGLLLGGMPVCFVPLLPRLTARRRSHAHPDQLLGRRRPTARAASSPSTPARWAATTASTCWNTTRA